MIPAESYQIARYKNMTYSEKWHTMISFRTFAIKIKSAGIRLQHPDWSDSDIERHVKAIFLNATT